MTARPTSPIPGNAGALDQEKYSENYSEKSILKDFSTAGALDPVTVEACAISEVSLTERELFIKIKGLTHFRIDRRELVGMQSWFLNRGHDEKHFQIEFYTKSSGSIVLDYDDQKLWSEILSGLDTVSFLEEWR